MIIISFNFRGFSSATKKLALKELVKTYDPDLLMLQETLGSGEDISGALKKMVSSWIFQSLDVKGRSRGLATRVKEGRLKVLNNWGLDQALGVEV